VSPRGVAWLCVWALVMGIHTTAGATPPRPARERQGIRLGPRHTLRLELGAGVLLDTNPTSIPADDLRRLLVRHGNSAQGSPGAGAFVAPAVRWRLDRHAWLLEVAGSARAWSAAFLAPPEPTDSGAVWERNGLRAWRPQLRLALDARLDGSAVRTVGRNHALQADVHLLRTTVPAAELLGTTLGRTSLSGALGGVGRWKKRAWSLGVTAGGALDVFDGFNADVQAWQALAKQRGTLAYPGGLAAFVQGNAEHVLSTRATLDARARVGPSLSATPDGLLGVSVPVTMVAGARFQASPSWKLRAEAGVWFPNTLCPGPAADVCPAEGRTPRRDTSVSSVASLLPLPVGLVQLDHSPDPRWMVSLTASKDARTTLLYAYVDDKRLTASVASLLTSTLGLRLAASAAVLSYGRVSDPTFSRPQVQPVHPGAARVQQWAGRQDAQLSVDASWRWRAQPWLVITGQQSLFALGTTVQVRRADGKWQNPGLVRSVTTLTAVLQW
jgi:hypothetical protein